MSDAVSATGILVKRRPTTLPATVVIATSSAANPTVITTSAPHGLRSFETGGDLTTIAGHAGSTPALNGVHEVTVIDATHFTVPVAVTVAGTGGTSQADFQVVAEIRSVGPGGKSRNKVPTSTHNEGSESHVLGIVRQKDPTVKINIIDDPSHEAIDDDFNANRKSDWQIAFRSGRTRTGQAYVQAIDYDEVGEDAVEGATITLAWAGTVTEARAA